jgi:uncharacterized cupin superfamily protein
MQKYPSNKIISDLQPWPFEGEASNYEIIRGNPQASGRLDLGTNEGQHRVGIWSCTEGAFICTEVGDELQTVISGQLTITRDDGESIECGPGDSIFTRKGERLTWDIKQTVTKVFFTYNPDARSEGWSDATVLQPAPR